jgi:hypothetical protein
MAETRNFKMHPKLLLDVIQKQAGSLAKAILEGAMNAVDAGATRFDITIDDTTVIMEDDGKGFNSRKDIEDFFEVFGQPHEEGDAHYGQFRMGRGQIFSYGHNFWRTGTWSMTVDVKEKGLEYKLDTMKKETKGCQILVSLYDPLDRGSTADAYRDVKRDVRYLEIPVYWHQNGNEERISIDPAKQKWDHSDEDCYIKFKDAGSLDVYNMGVYVKGFDRWHFGTGGVVVSKRPVEVNFARNDIQSTCPIWKKVKKKVDQRAQDRIKKKPLDDAARARLAMQFHSDEPGSWYEISRQRLITDCKGKHITVYSFMDKLSRFPVSHAPQGNRIGDRIMQTGLAYVLADETLERFQVGSITSLLKLLDRAGAPDRKADIRDIDALAERAIHSTTIIADKDLKPTEKLWLLIANCFPQGWAAVHTAGDSRRVRKFKVGVAQGLDGWTDGSSYIVIERGFLKHLKYSKVGDIQKLGALILHELCHENDDQEVSDHGPDFYERFHDKQSLICLFINEALAQMERNVKSVMKRTNKQLNVLFDRLDANGKELEAFDKLSKCLTSGGKLHKVDLNEIEAKLVAAETTRKQPKKKARKVANLNLFK